MIGLSNVTKSTTDVSSWNSVLDNKVLLKVNRYVSSDVTNYIAESTVTIYGLKKPIDEIKELIIQYDRHYLNVNGDSGIVNNGLSSSGIMCYVNHVSDSALVYMVPPTYCHQITGISNAITSSAGPSIVGDKVPMWLIVNENFSNGYTDCGWATISQPFSNAIKFTIPADTEIHLSNSQKYTIAYHFNLYYR